MSVMAVVAPYLDRIDTAHLEQRLSAAQLRTFRDVCEIAKDDKILLSSSEIHYLVTTFSMLGLIEENQRRRVAAEVVHAQMLDQLDQVLRMFTPD